MGMGLPDRERNTGEDRGVVEEWEGEVVTDGGWLGQGWVPAYEPLTSRGLRYGNKKSNVGVSIDHVSILIDST
ncbi:hypothetical protein ACH5RR_013557 [Cinchona calisaya]|uniref:Uncharacterized protein n=1 Tax=Cinchona calisaya TaxID=153742 RepID=A0ABD3A0C5_9GENT